LPKYGLLKKFSSFYSYLVAKEGLSKTFSKTHAGAKPYLVVFVTLVKPSSSTMFLYTILNANRQLFMQ
jgi:hypothetical protein